MDTLFSILFSPLWFFFVLRQLGYRRLELVTD